MVPDLDHGCARDFELTHPRSATDDTNNRMDPSVVVAAVAVAVDDDGSTDW